MPNSYSQLVLREQEVPKTKIAIAHQILENGEGCVALVEVEGNKLVRCNQPSKMVLQFEMFGDTYKPACSEDHVREIEEGVIKSLMEPQYDGDPYTVDRLPFFAIISKPQQEQLSELQESSFEIFSHGKER